MKPMKFVILDSGLWSVAESLAIFFKKKGYKKIFIEKPYNEILNFRPTLIFKKGLDSIIVEIRNNPLLTEYFEDFIKDCLVSGESARIYISVPKRLDDQELTFTHDFLKKIQSYGVGILLVEGRQIEEYIKAVKCNMRISLAECNHLSKNKLQVVEILARFNKGEYIDAIRDITEFVEGLVRDLATKASKKRRIVLRSKEVKKMDFEDLINLLSAPMWKNKKQKRYFEEDFKADLKSFKGARNLSHHPRDRELSRKLEQQVIERMHMGIRLTGDINKIRI